MSLQKCKEVAAGITEEIQCDPDNEYSLDLIKLKKNWQNNTLIIIIIIVYFSGSKT